ncbi:MAG: VOC family protein [Bdellovibrionota bacterium]|nr:VOC family protein [Bdellovibrionota bacterium]
MKNSVEFHHVGVISSNLEATLSFYFSIGYQQVGYIYEDLIQKSQIAILEMDSGPLVEVIVPQTDSPAFDWINRIKAGAYHTCYKCSDIRKSIEYFENLGLTQISEVEQAIAFQGNKIVFLWSAHTGLIELLELS